MIKWSDIARQLDDDGWTPAIATAVHVLTHTDAKWLRELPRLEEFEERRMQITIVRLLRHYLIRHGCGAVDMNHKRTWTQYMAHNNHHSCTNKICCAVRNEWYKT